MIIREATESDLPAIVEIFNAAIPSRMVVALLEPVSVDERRPWFRAHSAETHPLWVVQSPDGMIAAWLSLETFLSRCAYRGTAEVSVYVHEGFRRQGLAARLLRNAIGTAPRLGIDALVGYIFAQNNPSLEFFEHAGFERWGYLPRVARLDTGPCDLVIVGRHIEQ
jgi:L-amino acid N-acyltransferase YncA